MLNLTLKIKSIPAQNNRVLTEVIWTSGPNLVILAWMGDELWCGQTQNVVKFEFQVRFNIEDQGRSPQIRGTFNNVFCISGPNLMILAWTRDELSADKVVIDTPTHTNRLTQTQAKTIPEGQNWHRVKRYHVRTSSRTQFMLGGQGPLLRKWNTFNPNLDK